MRLALYQPDIPQNTGTLLRLAACLGVAVDIIEPCGFVFSDRHLRRAGMDYLDPAGRTHHASWDTFQATFGAARGETATNHAPRLVLLSTQAEAVYTDFRFHAGDTLMVGRESAGVPEAVHDRADARIRVEMVPGARSLNVAVAAAMVLGEAMRQTRS